MWVIYDEQTTRRYRNSRTRRDEWANQGTAKAEMTREGLCPYTYAMAELNHFENRIERTEVVYSIHDRKRERPITQSVNTPLCLDPSSETYWSM
jgi:hypothetical protein